LGCLEAPKKMPKRSNFANINVTNELTAVTRDAG
jgi:hypothetical protein